MRAAQEVAGGGFVVDDAPVGAGGDEVSDEGAVLGEGEPVDAADEVGTELGVAEVDDAAVVPPAVVGAGLEHAPTTPARPATPTRASIVAAVGRQGRHVLRRRRLTARA
ncbi:MAG: hypothetical protein L0H96_18735 [Humibacillus sp.]|nr:hypothetical protein [Humibacillus sp.]